MASDATEFRCTYATTNASESTTAVRDACANRVVSKVRHFLRIVSVEPVIVCYVLPNVLGSIGMQHLYLEKACRVELRYTSTVCDAVSEHMDGSKDTEAAVQRYVATAFAYKNVLQSVIPAVLLLFIGACSDRHDRRKPWLLLPLLCELATVVGFGVTTYFFYELGLIVNVLIDGVMPVMSGGGQAFATAVYAHISRITTEEDRMVRIGTANMVTNVCITLGSALTGIVYVRMGFYGVYGVSVLMYLIGLCYGVFWLTEAPSTTRPPPTACTCGDFFNLGHVKDTVSVAIRKGARNRKMRIWAIMLLVVVIMGPMHGEFLVTYLFVRYKFEWTEIDYSIFSTYYSIVHIGGTVFSLMVFSKYLQLDDAVVGMISSSSKVLAAAVYAFAPNSYVFYAAVLIEMFNGTSFIAMRSIISKLVQVDEIGKIYSLFGLCEALMPLLYGPLYTSIYKSSIDFMPGLYFIAGGLLTIPSVIVFGWLYLEHKKDLLLDDELDGVGKAVGSSEVAVAIAERVGSGNEVNL